MNDNALLAYTIGAVLLTAGCGRSEAPIVQNAMMPQVRALSQTSSYQVLYRFPVGMGNDGNGPLANLNGTLYGTTAGPAGTVYSITPGGREKTLYRFTESASGYGPSGPLAVLNGTLYGTTLWGGRCGHGIAYSITTTGTETQIHSFCGNDGANATGLTNLNGTLYGTAEYNAGGFAKGTIFKITTEGAFKVLYAFGSQRGDALGPQAPPIWVKGALYGTTAWGGTGDCGDGCGAVYRVSLNGKEKVTYSFQGRSDGSAPIGALTNIGGTLYGTTLWGGSHQGHNGRKDSCCGTFYSLTLSGEHHVLRNFGHHPGASFPNTTLIKIDGVLYGTSGGGTKQQLGTVYKITVQGSEHVLHRFAGGTEGAKPDAALTKLNGTLYGTTDQGGDLRCAQHGLKVGCGVVYSLTP
jgi:uncharacterized repeat protein (TIGR03803 family)